VSIYFTHPHTITVGEVAYYYAGSVLLFWQIPHDPSDNSFTMSMGGAAVALEASPGVGGTSSGGSGDQGPAGPTGGGETVIPSPPASPTLSLPTAGGSPIPAPVLAASGSPRHTAAGVASPLTQPAGFNAGGVGAGWIVFLLAAAGLAGVFLPRLPALLGAAANPICELERARRGHVGGP
jgi:hypothetical protein